MRQSFSSGRPETAAEPPLGPRGPAVERIAGWSATHRKTAVIGWLLLVAAVFVGGRMVSSTNVPSYDAGQSGRAEQILNRLNVTFPPAESVLIQSRSPGRTVAAGPGQHSGELAHLRVTTHQWGRLSDHRDTSRSGYCRVE